MKLTMINKKNTDQFVKNILTQKYSFLEKYYFMSKPMNLTNFYKERSHGQNRGRKQIFITTINVVDTKNKSRVFLKNFDLNKSFKTFSKERTQNELQ